MDQLHVVKLLVSNPATCLLINTHLEGDLQESVSEESLQASQRNSNKRITVHLSITFTSYRL